MVFFQHGDLQSCRISVGQIGVNASEILHLHFSRSG
jgi:hypothetical protein